MEETRSLAQDPTPSKLSRRAKLGQISHELIRGENQDQKTLLTRLLRMLGRDTEAQYGHLILTDKNGTPDHCLVLEGQQIQDQEDVCAATLLTEGLTGWAYQHRQGIVIADTSQDPHWSDWVKSLTGAAEGSALAIPLWGDDQLIGTITLIADRPHHFDETDLVLVTSLANQTALLLANIQLNALVEQKQTIISTLCQTAHTINTSQELDQILYAVLDQLAQIVPYRGAVVLLQEDERLQPVAAVGFSAKDALSRINFELDDSPTLSQALRQRRTAIVSDDETLQELESLNPLPSTPGGSLAIAPLKANNETLGLVVLTSATPHNLGAQEIPLINTLADHTAMALANHRLAQETNQRLRELAFLNETGQAITSTLNLDRILQLLLERVRDLLKIDAVSIALRDKDSQDLVFEAASGKGAVGVLGVRLKPGQGIAGWVAETGKPLIVPDAYHDTRFFPEVDKQTGMTTHAVLCVPIVLKGHVVGVIEALNPGEVSFDQNAIELLNALSSHAATAIHNARLFAQARSAEARYEGLFEDSVNPIIITDLKGIILDANRNACALLGQSKESLQGTNLSLLRSADGTLDFQEPHRQILTDQESTFETKILTNGQRATIKIQGKQVSVKGTTLIQWIGRDISAEIELEQTREDMVRMIVHDLRNPLANIMNSLDVLQEVIDEQGSGISQNELLSIAKRSGQRLQQLISSILDISRLESGQVILETQPAALPPLLRDAIKFVQPQADIREIDLTLNLDEDLPPLPMDKDMISRVILNLLDNAIKFTQVGGKVNLAASKKGSVVQVKVSDNGPGIPASQIKSIFDKFVRVRNQDSPKGTGLGLAFCKLAIKAHQGNIWAESELGQGATFYFTLPTHPKPQSH